jgi:lysophospholipid acyltransferase (LPLAT)-like uncharacterized protein
LQNRREQGNLTAILQYLQAISIPVSDTQPSAPSFLQRVGVWLAPLLITLLIKTLRIKVHGSDPRGRGKFVVAFWHGGMLVPWYAYRKHNGAALVSASADGEVLARILHAWGVAVVRGSSSAGGSDAVKTMVDLAKEGRSVLITPDGPRGPAHKMKIGALVVAQRAELPLVLCAVKYHKKKILRSWDSFEIPMPFSRADVCYSEPITIPTGCTGEALETMMQAIEKQLQELNANA